MLRWLPLITGIMPLVATFGAFAIGVAYDVLPDCNPIIDGCRSISATGRRPPGSFLFRAIMLPQSILLGFLWYLSWRWLCALRPALSRPFRFGFALAGVTNVVALAVYVTFLGTTEPIYEFMRRIGAHFGFVGMAAAQLLVAAALFRTPLRSLATKMLAISAVVFLVGILNLILKSVLADPDPAENRIEWIAAILMQLWFFVLFVAWRRTSVDISVRVGPT